MMLTMASEAKQGWGRAERKRGLVTGRWQYAPGGGDNKAEDNSGYILRDSRRRS